MKLDDLLPFEVSPEFCLDNVKWQVEKNMDAQANCDHPRLQPYVVRSGTAMYGKTGPPAGLVDIGISQNAYLCRVAIPGIQKEPSMSSFYTLSSTYLLIYVKLAYRFS